MNKYKTAALSATLALVLYVIVGSLIGKVQSNFGEFVYFTFIFFPPMFILSICAGFIFNWLFNAWAFTKRTVRMFIALLISSAISIGYLMVTWLIFGDFIQLITESIGILLISVSVVTLTEVLTKTKVELILEKRDV